MSTATAPSSHLNGASALSAEVLREAEFLKRILQIRDDVLASKHPRIHLPAKVIEQVAPRPPQTAFSRPTTNGTSNGSASQLLPPRSAHSARPPTSPIPPTQRPYSAKSSSSGIDPVLLEKSEHLVKAEQQLKRQQIERALKDQFDKKGRSNDADEREALIDVEQCLIKAHQLVPPVSGLPSTTNNSDGAESFDENSYYSSKADSWSPEQLDPADHSHADAGVTLTSQAKQTAQQVNVHARAPEPTVIDLDEEAYEPADDIEIYEPPEPAPVLEDGEEGEEEEDYSPPPADIVPSEPSRGRARNRHGGTNGYDTETFLLSFFRRLSRLFLKHGSSQPDAQGFRTTYLDSASSIECCRAAERENPGFQTFDLTRPDIPSRCSVFLVFQYSRADKSIDHAAKVLLDQQRLSRTLVSGEEMKSENATRRDVNNRPASGLLHRLNRTSKRSHSRLLRLQVTLTRSLVSVVRCSLTPMK